MIPADNVLMGVPKKGRLYDRCMKLLAGAGMDHRRVSGNPLLLYLYTQTVVLFFLLQSAMGLRVERIRDGLSEDKRDYIRTIFRERREPSLWVGLSYTSRR